LGEGGKGDRRIVTIVIIVTIVPIVTIVIIVTIVPIVTIVIIVNKEKWGMG